MHLPLPVGGSLTCQAAARRMVNVNRTVDAGLTVRAMRLAEPLRHRVVITSSAPAVIEVAGLHKNYGRCTSPSPAPEARPVPITER